MHLSPTLGLPALFMIFLIVLILFGLFGFGGGPDQR
jgi:hypothetical protein